MKGFSLIELLVSIAIMSILVGIVAPDLAKLRKRGFDLAAKNLARNVAIKQEDYFVDNDSYFSCENTACEQYTRPLKIPQDIEIEVNGGESSYLIKVKHRKGTGKVFIFDIEQGGFID